MNAGDLLYLGTLENVERAEKSILEKYPNAKLERDYDFVHEYRLEVEIPECDPDEWAIWALAEGLGAPSFFIQCELIRNPQKVRDWLDALKE